MIDLTSWHTLLPYSLDRVAKGALLVKGLVDLTMGHAERCLRIAG